MDTLLIQLTNNKAYKLLQDLEELRLIKVLGKREKAASSPQRKSATARFRGALNLTSEQYTDFQNHATEIRKEWPDSIESIPIQRSIT
jgi:hypothetical protein